MKEIIQPSTVEDGSLKCFHHPAAINCCVHIRGHRKVTKESHNSEEN